MPNRRSRREADRLTAKTQQGLATRSAEQLLIEAVQDVSAERVFCTSLGRGQVGQSLAAKSSGSRVVCLFLDLYQAQQAERAVEPPLENLQILCAADPPEEEFDLAALPFTQGGEAELTRDLLQSAHQRLGPGGQLVTAIDNPKDTWLREEMERLFAKVTRQAERGGQVYRAIKREELKKTKNFDGEFKFRDREQLISVVTRPGVFSHRRLDTGARAMMEVMEIDAGMRVLDLGCGSGVLSLAAAFRAAGVTVLALDANARAVQCTQRSAELNGLSTIEAKLNAEAAVEDAGCFDVVLANPPYYSNYRIAELFLRGAFQALKPGGRLYVVAKSAEWYDETMPQLFDRITTESARGYVVIRGTKR